MTAKLCRGYGWGFHEADNLFCVTQLELYQLLNEMESEEHAVLISNLTLCIAAGQGDKKSHKELVKLVNELTKRKRAPSEVHVSVPLTETIVLPEALRK